MSIEGKERKIKAELEQRELEYVETEVAEGLLMMNEAKSVTGKHYTSSIVVNIHA